MTLWHSLRLMSPWPGLGPLPICSLRSRSTPFLSSSRCASRYFDAVDDQQYHQQMATLYAQQRLKPEPRPDDVDVQSWKNRHLISAKLSAPLYADLMAFCRQHGFSVNTAIRAILSAHFKHPTNG